MEQKVFQRGADKRIDLRGDLGIAELFFSLPLELRLLEIEAKNDYYPFACVLGRDSQAFRREVVDVDVVAHCLDNSGFEPGFMSAAERGRDAVHERVETFFRRFSPGEHTLQRRLVFSLKREDLRDDRFFLTVSQELGQVGSQTVLVMISGLFAGRFMAKDQGQAFM